MSCSNLNIVEVRDMIQPREKRDVFDLDITAAEGLGNVIEPTTLLGAVKRLVADFAHRNVERVGIVNDPAFVLGVMTTVCEGRDAETDNVLLAELTAQPSGGEE